MLRMMSALVTFTLEASASSGRLVSAIGRSIHSGMTEFEDGRERAEQLVEAGAGLHASRLANYCCCGGGLSNKFAGGCRSVDLRSHQGGFLRLLLHKSQFHPPQTTHLICTPRDFNRNNSQH